jgi:carbon monoxide dehydrogenase subunit G
MAYEATVPVHRRLLWSAVTDPERLLGAVPNLVVEASTEQSVAARLRLRVGDRTITFRGVARLVELVPEQLRAVLEIEAVHGRSDGTLEGRLELRLLAAGSGTRVLITPDLGLSGSAPTVAVERLAEVAQRLIPRWFEQLASSAPTAAEPHPVTPESHSSPVTLTVVPDSAPQPATDAAAEKPHDSAEPEKPAEAAKPEAPAAKPAKPATPPSAPTPVPPSVLSAAELPPHGPTLTLITGDAEDASPSPKAPLRLVSDAEQDPDYEPAAEPDLWSRGRGPILIAPLWLLSAAAVGLFGLAAVLVRYLLRRR